MAHDASSLARQDVLAEKACDDPQAFEDLYHCMMREIYGFVIKRVGHRETAEDLVADIFRKVFCNLSSFSPHKGHFRTWVYRIATNVLIDHYRVHHHPEKPAPLDIDDIHNVASSDNLAINMERLDDREQVRRCMDTLSAKQKMVVTLRYFDDYSNKEIAVVCGMSETHVAVTLHRALKHLQKIMIFAQ